MKKISLLIAIGLLTFSCSKNESPDPPEANGPKINSFSPTSGAVGTDIWITGQNFGSTNAANTVKIGNVTAPISSSSTSEIFITVPEGATTGTISVTVDGKTDTAGTFTVTVPVSQFPTLSELPTDTFYPGDVVTLTGSGFDVSGEYEVIFPNNLSGEIIEVNEGSIKVKVPEGAITGDIALSFNNETKEVGILNIGSPAAFYIFDYTQNQLAEVNIKTGGISFFGSEIPYGYNTRGAIIHNNFYIGFQMEDQPNMTNPNIVSIDLDTGAYSVTYLVGVADNAGFDDFVVDSEGNLYIFHHSDINRLAKIDLDTGELSYIGDANLNYGNNTRGAVYHETNNEYIGFATHNKDNISEPHLERFNLETGTIKTVNIPEFFLTEGSDFEELVISPEGELYIFHRSVNRLAKINMDTGELTYIDYEYSSQVYGLNTRGAVISDNQFIGFQMHNQNNETSPNIAFIDLITGESSNIEIDKEALPESINLTDFAIKR